MNNELAAALQRRLARWQKCAPCLGSNVAIIDGKYGSWSGAAGWRDIDSEQKMPPGARFYIYSITKIFVAVCLLQLEAALDAPISTYLPDIVLAEGVTVRRLLNHTAGLPSYTDLPDYEAAVAQSPGQPWSAGDVFARCCDGRLDFAPGEGWHYSNTGYLLLARLIERLTGASLKSAIADGILKPLGLNQSYIADIVDHGCVTPGYSRYFDADAAMVNVVPVYHPGWCLTGLMVSTVEEVARFLTALMSGSLLDPGSLAEMVSAVPCPAVKPAAGPLRPFFQRPSYGLGLMVDPDWGHGGLFGHGGDGPGANTWAMHLPDFHGRPVTLVAFCNTTMGGHPVYLVKDLLRVLAGV